MPPSISPSPTILLPHLPPKTLVGIDLITFTSTPNFHGIRDLPDGWHFLYTGTTESFSLRCGAWFYVGDMSAALSDSKALLSTHSLTLGREIFIWKWDRDVEALVAVKGLNDAERQEVMRYKANLGAIWQGGGLWKYRSRGSAPSGSAGGNKGEGAEEEEEEEGRRDWHDLTDKITPKLLSRIVGDPEMDLDGRPRWVVTSASTANRDADEIPGLAVPGEGPVPGSGEMAGEEEKEFSFLPIDLKQTWRDGAIGRERTEAAQDRSWALGDLIRRFSGTPPSIDERWGEAQILGELQFTFLMVLTMMNYSCLQQWKRLLGLILTCRSAIKERESFIANVLRLLLVQLQRCDDVEGGLFEINGDEGGEFLRKLLTKFKVFVDEVVDGAESKVKSELDKLETWVKDEYDWEIRRGAILRRGMLQLEDGEEVEMEINEGDEDDETGEYAPVVVDLGAGSTTQEDLDMRDT